MNDRATTLEHMSSAMSGADSRDWLAALAMAQVAPGAMRADEAKALRGLVGNGVGGQAQVTAVGVHLTRLQVDANQLSYNQARDSIAGLVKKLNEVRRWRLTDSQVRRVAESALLMHLHPTCGHCHGRQYEAILDTPSLSKIECPSCHGTGNRAMPRRQGSEVAHVLNVLGLIQGLTERAVAKKFS